MRACRWEILAVSAEGLGGGLNDPPAPRWGCPRRITFKPNRRLWLEQIRWACESAFLATLVLVDAGYGNDFQAPSGGHHELERHYVAGISAADAGVEAGQAAGPRHRRKGHVTRPAYDPGQGPRTRGLSGKTALAPQYQWREGPDN